MKRRGIRPGSLATVGADDTALLGRRGLLLGAGAAALSAACGAEGEYDPSEPTSEEPVDVLEQALVDYSPVPSWSWNTITTFFTSARDTRWVKMDGDPNFVSRRISWLYPDGGCEARAELICYRAGLQFLTKPYKLYCAGALRFTTSYAKPGTTSVTWGFHIAPVVKSSGTGNVYVLDPSIDWRGPLPVNTWVSKINGSANGLVLNDSRYWGPLGRGDSWTAFDQMEGQYLKLEWDRLVALGKDPSRELGDYPPWA